MGFFIASGTPFFLASFAVTMLAMLLAMRLEALQQLRALGIAIAPSATEQRRRLIIGQLQAAPIVAILILSALSTPDSYRPILLVISLLAYLYFGMVLPRKPLVDAQKQGRTLRKLVPGFASYIRVALVGSDPKSLLERYIARVQPRKAAMQQAVTEALYLVNEERRRPFEALAIVARAKNCRELIDLAEALAQAEQEGSDVRIVLAAQEETLRLIIEDEFSRELQRRNLYVLGLSAIGLVVGVMGQILFTVTRGGEIFIGM